MPDEPHLFEYLTVEEHLRLIGAPLRGCRFRARARGALLDELELDGQGASLPGELSRGMRQKVVIACGLVRDARRCCSTSRSPGSTRSASGGCAARSSRARAPARRSCCPRTSCTWSRRSARASSSWTAAARSLMARSQELAVARRSRGRRLEPRADLPARHRPRVADRRLMLQASLYIIVCTSRNRMRDAAAAAARAALPARRDRRRRVSLLHVLRADARACAAPARRRAERAAGRAAAGARRVGRRRSPASCCSSSPLAAGCFRSTAACSTSPRRKRSFSFLRR